MLSLYTRAQQEKNGSGEPNQPNEIRPFHRHEAGVSDQPSFRRSGKTLQILDARERCM
jgi:hypothetical protein